MNAVTRTGALSIRFVEALGELAIFQAKILVNLFKPPFRAKLLSKELHTQGVLSLSWQTDDGEDLRDDITRDLLAATMGLRLTETLREELGATYSPQAISFSQRTFDGCTVSELEDILGRLLERYPDA